MKKIYFGIIIYNILLITFVFYTIFFANNDIKMNYLKDVSGKGEEEGIEVLSDYQIAVEYVESQVKKDVILYSKPSAGELVYENQMVTLYISKGYLSEKYRKLENMMYDDCKEYLESLTKNYKIEVVITYEKNNKQEYFVQVDRMTSFFTKKMKDGSEGFFKQFKGGNSK